MVVSIMPCTAKKAEITRPEHFTDGEQNVDYVLTTTEITRMIQEAGIDLAQVQPEALDMPFGLSSGAGAIFGVTGGVMEAALRSAYYFAEGKNPGPDDFSVVRGEKGIREVTVTIAGREVRAAVVTGLANAEKMMQRIRKGKAQYDFVEVMACPGGCIGGGGQPKDLMKDADETRKSRIAALYRRDEAMTLRTSHENPEILEVYKTFYGKPLSELAEKMLHTAYQDRSGLIKKKGRDSVKKWKCQICGYIYDEEKEGIPFDELPEDWVCPLCGASKSVFAPEEPTIEAKPQPAPIHHDSEMRLLSVGELAAVCSNLARGCEKQYQEREATLFREIADFLTAAQSPVADPTMDKLLELIRQEDRKRPFSDQKLAELLEEQGIHIARRTVAKYRMELRLGSAAARKQS